MSLFKNSNVIELTDNNFSGKNIQGHSQHNCPFVILFYAPWCGHCVNFKQTYKNLASSTHGHLKCYAVNCDNKNTEGIKKLCKIQGFPTIKYGRSNGEITDKEYSGGRDQDSITSYLCSNISRELNKAPFCPKKKN